MTSWLTCLSGPLARPIRYNKSERTKGFLAERVTVANPVQTGPQHRSNTVGQDHHYSERTRLDRALRDAETVCQHIVMQHKTLAMAGAMLLEADTPVVPYI
jgi:hypothetical protein